MLLRVLSPQQQLVKVVQQLPKPQTCWQQCLLLITSPWTTRQTARTGRLPCITGMCYWHALLACLASLLAAVVVTVIHLRCTKRYL